VIPVKMTTPFPIGDGKLPEHYTRWVDPFIALAIAAGATRKIKLATGICLLPEREPLITAKLIASLDYYSNGRVIIGAGAGWLKEETEAMGAKFGTRWRRMRETVEAMRTLWTKAEASYEGELVRFPAVRCDPKPVQKPYPPILLGAHGPKALERVARTYDGWMPLVESLEQFKGDVINIRKLAKEHGRDPDSLQITAIVDPDVRMPGADDLKRYRDAGASRLIPFSQKMGSDSAAGKAQEQLRQFASLVEIGKSI
jgi:probable F420-dependent oxidoreductase